MSEETEKKVYELGYLIISPEKESGILEIVKSAGGEVVDQRGASQVKLAYPIEKHETAYLGVCYFESENHSPEKIDKALKSDPEVLRSLLLIRPIKKERGAKRERFKKPQKESTVQSQPQPATAVTNEALEEKLEEILK